MEKREEPTYFQVPSDDVALLQSAVARLNPQLFGADWEYLRVREVLSPGLPEGQSEIAIHSDGGLVDFDTSRMVFEALNRLVQEQIRPQLN